MNVHPGKSLRSLSGTRRKVSRSPRWRAPRRGRAPRPCEPPRGGPEVRPGCTDAASGRGGGSRLAGARRPARPAAGLRTRHERSRLNRRPRCAGSSRREPCRPTRHQWRPSPPGARVPRRSHESSRPGWGPLSPAAAGRVPGRPCGRDPPGDGRGAGGRSDLHLPPAGPVPDPGSAAQPGRVGVPRHPRSLRGAAEPGRRREPRARGGDRLRGVGRQHDLHLHPPRQRPLVERRSGHRPRLRLRLAAGPSTRPPPRRMRGTSS